MVFGVRIAVTAIRIAGAFTTTGVIGTATLEVSGSTPFEREVTT
jgi:hypothetical protein